MNYGPGRPDETGELVALERLARTWGGRRVVVFDVGANAGDYAKEVLALAADVDLHCFEPSEEARRALETRVAGRAHVHPFGLGSKDERAVMFGDARGSGLMSVYPRRLVHHGLEAAPQGEVLLRRLDDVATEVGVERIDLLKLDVEGHELAVLKGAGDLLVDGKIDAIQFEFGGASIDAHVYFQDFWYLLAPHYRIHRILRDGLLELGEYHESQEVFITSNYLCLRRT
jgi:FkbM family methyltransferase